MPKFNLQPKEVALLADFITVSLREPRLEQPAGVPDGDPQQGFQLYRRRGCGLCHQRGLEGGAVGPDLSAVSRRLQPAFIRQHLLDPRLGQPEGPEPRYAWTEEELMHVTTFLLSASLREGN
jgi:cbb3-type cytochrome oxidase cytochrome c subunit